jgi:choline dehydrogenase-like flavoprotein
MFIDANEMNEGSTVRSDVCIVGSGPAGITVAKQLGRTNRRVCVLAGGSIHQDPRAQSLTVMPTTGDPYLAPSATRFRQFGGNSNVWCIKVGAPRLHVRYLPLQPHDFVPRSWVPHSGWPIPYEEVRSYYERAHRAADAGPFEYAAEPFIDPAHPPLPLDERLFKTSVQRYGPGAAYYDPAHHGLDRASNVVVVLNAHATDIRAGRRRTTVGGDQHVEEVIAKTLDGRQLRVKAKRFVIAAGGIESARLLMVANGGDGIGSSPALGRYYIDHPLVSLGDFVPAGHVPFERLGLYDLRRVRDVPVMGKLEISEAAQAEHRLLNSCMTLFPRSTPAQTDAVTSAQALLDAVRDGTAPSRLPQHLWRVVRHARHLAAVARDKIVEDIPIVPGFGRGGWSRHSNLRARFSRFEVFGFFEQAPDPDNRIELTDERDGLGVPQARLHWRWNDIDVDSVRRTQALMARAFHRSGWGRFDHEPFTRERGRSWPQGLAHHMGATRMASSRRDGVVDEQCRVHGVDNLYVASSSVFPTGGYANPTLTLIALSLRLADHLQRLAARDDRPTEIGSARRSMNELPVSA